MVKNLKNILNYQKPFQFSISKSIENILGINLKVLFNDFKEHLEYKYGQKTKIFLNGILVKLLLIWYMFHQNGNQIMFFLYNGKKNDFSVRLILLLI